MKEQTEKLNRFLGPVKKQTKADPDSLKFNRIFSISE
jgi:hypothetical protein